MSQHHSEVPVSQVLEPTFSATFLQDHARRIISKPGIALTEIVANCWDAGADRVDITWPASAAPELIEIKDNGVGMTYEEFARRWLEFSYDRRKEQGEDVVFPPDNAGGHRKAFGRNGKGRHSMFCFAEEYTVETWRDGVANVFRVKRTSGTRRTPYEIVPVDRFGREGHGTVVSAELGRNYLPVPVVRDLIGSKFVTDPAFKVYLNGELLELTDLQHLIETEDVAVTNVGTVQVSRIDTRKTSKTSHPHGVAWWVNGRLVGEPSWRDFQDSGLLDRRTVEAKRYTFVVQANILADDVEPDWCGFEDSERVQSVRRAVEKNIRRRLYELMRDDHRARKRAALEENREALAELPHESRYAVGQMVDGLQQEVPTVKQRVLSAVVSVVTRLEKARSGYALLEQLASLQPDELDQLHEILQRWTVQEARVVLGELERRLNVIEQLERLLEDPSSNELHEIQPLFERGLWVFGPEYESIHFTSNQSLLTVVTHLLNDRLAKPLQNPRKRPDFVITADSTIGVYASDAFDERSEVSGFDKIAIVELKRGGWRVTIKERRQAEDYAKALRRSGKVQRATKITAFVLGTQIDDDVLEPIEDGNTTVLTRPYAVVLQQAHARTFRLMQKIREAKREQLVDPDVEQVLTMPSQARLFSP